MYGELGDADDFSSGSVRMWMTRFCIQCNRIIGEKCVQCGTEVTASSNGDAVTGASCLPARAQPGHRLFAKKLMDQGNRD